MAPGDFSAMLGVPLSSWRRRSYGAAVRLAERRQFAKPALAVNARRGSRGEPAVCTGVSTDGYLTAAALCGLRARDYQTDSDLQGWPAAKPDLRAQRLERCTNVGDEERRLLP